jgi:hypothetical protein
MYTLTDLVEKIYSETGLTNYSKNSIINDINDYYLQVCAENNWQWLEKEFDITTTALTQEYYLDISNLMIVSASYEEVGIRKHIPMRYIANFNEWETIINGHLYASTTASSPYLFTIRDNKIIVFPNLENSNDIIHIRCTANPIPMTMEDYSTGTIAVTSGDATITGTGTDWLDVVKEGSSIKIESKWYVIGGITSDTELELTRPYQGATKSGISDYRIGDTPLIPENAQSILWKMFCEDYFNKHPDGNKNQVYEKQVYKIRSLLEKVSSDKVTTKVWDNNPLKRNARNITRDIFTVYSD